MAVTTRRALYWVLGASLVPFLGGCSTMPTSSGQGSTSSTQESVNEAVGVQELRREIADLRDTVEVQRNELDKLKQRQQQLYGDLDYRLRQAEQAAGISTGGQQAAGYGQSQQGYGGTQAGSQTGNQSSSGQSQQASSGQSSGGQQAGSQSTQQQQVYGQQGVSQGTSPAKTQSSTQSSQQGQSTGGEAQQTASAQPSTSAGQGPTQVAVATAPEQAAYDSAFELLKQSRYADAIIAFRSLISKFPHGALIDDAQYWIGEAYYVTRDFDNSLKAFQAVVTQYPDSQRVPEAMLKLGYVQAELGKTDQARQTLNQVISQYPGSRVAISAETRLNKLR